MSRTVDRVASWSVDADGTVRFVYQRYQFFVTASNMQDVLRDIGKLAANPVCDLDWNDAEYLTSLIREVMDLQAAHDEPCECNLCVMQDLYSLGWIIMMGLCCAAFWVALITFFIWGA